MNSGPFRNSCIGLVYLSFSNVVQIVEYCVTLKTVPYETVSVNSRQIFQVSKTKSGI